MDDITNSVQELRKEFLEKFGSLERRIAALEGAPRMPGVAAAPRPAPAPAPGSGSTPGGDSCMIDILRDLDDATRATDAVIRKMEGGDALLLLEDSLDAEDDPSGLEGLKRACDVLSALMTRIREMDAAPGAGADQEALRKAEAERDDALRRAERAEAELAICREALWKAEADRDAQRTRADTAEADLLRMRDGIA